MPAGRPTKYKPEYCEMLVEHMREGFSFLSFGGLREVDCGQNTLYEWEKAHPEFQEAKIRGEQACRLQWEKLGMKESKEAIPSGTYRLNMVNRFKDWTDKKELEHIHTIRDLSDEEIEAELASLDKAPEE